MQTHHRRSKSLLVFLLFSSLISACGTRAASPAPEAVFPVSQPTATTVAAKPSATAAVATTAPAAPTAPVAVTPTGELRIATTTFAGGALDPAMGAFMTARFLGGAIFDSLVGVTPGGKPGPGAAERWEMSLDGKTWTFYLRRGIKFHDGTDLTAADAKFSLERILAPEATSTNAASLRSSLASVVARDNFTLVLNLKQPDAEAWKFLSLLGGGEGLIVPKKYIEEKGVQYFRDRPIGSGAWKFVKYDFNNRLDLEAVDNYWGGTPQFKKLTILAIPEESTRVSMLKTGDIDMAEIATDSVPDIKAASSSGIRVVKYAAEANAAVAFYYDLENPRGAPVGDVRVRKALSLAINNQEMAETLFKGFASAMAMYFVPPTSIYYDATALKPEPYDPTQAKKLLADAGYPNGFSTKIIAVPLRPWLPTLDEAVASYWSKIGVKADIVPMDYSALRPHLAPKTDQTVWGNAVGWSGFQKYYFAFETPFHSKVMHRNHSNTELDALIEKTSATMDPVERKKLVLQTSLVAKAESAYVGLLDIDTPVAIGKNIGDFTPISGAYIPALEASRVTRAR